MMKERVKRFWIVEKVRRSFTLQLTLWVSAIVTVIFCITIFLLASFSMETVRDEAIDAAMQAVENTVTSINNRERVLMISTELERLRVGEQSSGMRQRVGASAGIGMSGMGEQSSGMKTEQRPMAEDKALLGHLFTEKDVSVGLIRSMPHAETVIVDMEADDALVPRGITGYHHYIADGEERIVFYQPLRNDRWSVAITCPASDLNNRFSRPQTILTATGLGAMLLLLLFCWITIGYHLRPLHLLAESARRIASGKMDEPIHDSKQKNEIGQLQNSFAIMKRTLADYMDEMKQKQETMSRQNEELQEAYSQAQEYDQVQARFLSNLTDSMVAPIDKINRLTDRLSNDYNNLSPTEMAKIQVEVLACTDTVTQLLDNLLNNNQ